MYKTEVLFYTTYKKCMILSKEEFYTTIKRLYTTYRGYTVEELVNLVVRDFYNVFPYGNGYWLSPVDELDARAWVNLIIGGNLGKPNPRYVPKQYVKNHKGYRWKTAHYIGRLKLYTELSTLGMSYRHKNRDAGMKHKYQDIGDNWDYQVAYSSGWKHYKKRHQWE